MKTASLADIKKELKYLSEKDLQAVVARLAGYKKENKELLHYLLFEAADEEAYVEKVKEEVQALFADVNTNSLYQAKKTLRRILRVLQRHVKYSGQKETEVRLLTFFCQQVHASGLPIHRSSVLTNLIKRQFLAIDKATATLHEDLQYDYQQGLATLAAWRRQLAHQKAYADDGP